MFYCYQLTTTTHKKNTPPWRIPPPTPQWTATSPHYLHRIRARDTLEQANQSSCRAQRRKARQKVICHLDTDVYMRTAVPLLASDLIYYLVYLSPHLCVYPSLSLSLSYPISGPLYHRKPLPQRTSQTGYSRHTPLTVFTHFLPW